MKILSSSINEIVLYWIGSATAPMQEILDPPRGQDISSLCVLFLNFKTETLDASSDRVMDGSKS